MHLLSLRPQLWPLRSNFNKSQPLQKNKYASRPLWNFHRAWDAYYIYVEESLSYHGDSMLSIGRSGIFYQYSLHGYPYEQRKRTYMGRRSDQYWSRHEAV